MLKERRRFLIRCVLIAAALTLAVCMGMAQALPEEEHAAEQTPVWIGLEIDGYLLEFENLLPPSITYAADADTPQPDMRFSVDIDAAVAEEEAKAEAQRAATRAAEGLYDDEETAEESEHIEEIPAEAEAETEQTEAPDDAEEEEQARLLPIFTMKLDEDVGDWVVLLTDDAGSVLPVAFDMAAAPEDLDEKQTTAFSLAQGDVQVLLATLKLVSLPGDEADAQQGEAPSGLLQADDYELSFAADIAGLLTVHKTEDGAFEFKAEIAGSEETVYTLIVGSEEGDIVLMLTDAGGAKIPAAFRMSTCPQELEKEERMHFYQAQETVAQVMSSLALQ